MSRAGFVLRYALFAVIAILANLAVQRAVLALFGPDSGLVPALLCGTAAGLLIKYLLDKRWIFFDSSSGLGAHGRRFALYSATGVFTTAIFWGTEVSFWLLWHSDILRDLGAVLGLTLGYCIKYRLDRHLVFTPGPSLKARSEGGAA